MAIDTFYAYLGVYDDPADALADYEAVPDIDELVHGIETAVARLAASSHRRKRAGDRHGLTLVHSA